MSHPYSGPASYIYANERLDDEDAAVKRGIYYPLPASFLSSPPGSPLSQAKPWSPIFDRAFASVPQFTTDFKSDRYKKFSRSSHEATIKKGTIDSEPYVYESMRVRFDTPNEHIVVWRRKFKLIKRKLGRFRREVTKLINHNWITRPRPRLSMIH